MSLFTPFRSESTPTERLLETISNQLQLANRQAVLGRIDAVAQAAMAQTLEAQIQALVTKVLEQRSYLNIAVNGV